VELYRHWASSRHGAALRARKSFDPCCFCLCTFAGVFDQPSAGSTQGVSGESELFNKNIKRLNQIENEYKGRMKAREDAESFRKQEPLVDQIGLGNQAEATVSKLRRQRREE